MHQTASEMFAVRLNSFAFILARTINFIVIRRHSVSWSVFRAYRIRTKYRIKDPRSFTQIEWKKSARRRHKHCALAVVRRSQKFRPAADPFLGAWDGQNLISWRWSLPSPTDPVWWESMHAISSYRDIRPTNTHTHPQTWPITINCAAASLARSVQNQMPFSVKKALFQYYGSW